MDPMQVVQEWQMDLDHMPEGQEQALEQQEVVQMTGRQMGRHKGQEQFDFALEIVGVVDIVRTIQTVPRRLNTLVRQLQQL